ncbi:MAG TPA: enoyl-CoA hydratase/isomerase family protein [Desulfobacteraceae bacterium]|nr:enoyl-CoA hydratase/isomerase family protein [Desulfobacteraceae bacterium]
MGYRHIETEIIDGVGKITLNRPPLNIMNIAMMEEINSVLKEWKDKKDMKLLLFNAKGKAFSAGVDVGEHMGDLAPRMIEVFDGMFRLLNTYLIPTVASVQGACLGGGCELSLFCDMVIATENAKIGQPEIQVGVFPPIAVYLFPRIIGRKAATELILTGRIITSQEAKEMGLVNRVVKDNELEKETEEFIKGIRGLSAEVLRWTKKAIVENMEEDLERGLSTIEDIYLNHLMKSHDANEGLKAFLEKRRPQWKNE